MLFLRALAATETFAQTPNYLHIKNQRFLSWTKGSSIFDQRFPSQNTKLIWRRGANPRKISRPNCQCSSSPPPRWLSADVALSAVSTTGFVFRVEMESSRGSPTVSSREERAVWRAERYVKEIRGGMFGDETVTVTTCTRDPSPTSLRL